MIAYIFKQKKLWKASEINGSMETITNPEHYRQT